MAGPLNPPREVTGKVVRPREGCAALATRTGENVSMLVTGRFGAGRVLAYTSHPAPHWVCNFIYWEQYQRFWSNALDWLLAERRGGSGQAG